MIKLAKLEGKNFIIRTPSNLEELLHKIMKKFGYSSKSQFDLFYEDFDECETSEDKPEILGIACEDDFNFAIDALNEWE